MTTAPLPATGPALLLRALFKPASAASAASSEALATSYLLQGIDAGELRRYNALLGFASDALPVTFYYLLVQRAHLGTLLAPAFPFRIAGMVHVENTITERRALAAGSPLELVTTVRIEPPTENGARYCELHTAGMQAGEVVFECHSRYLAVRGQRRTGQGGQPPAAAAATHDGQASLLGRWTLAHSAGRAYASVSGDWNPIHVHALTARPLGFPSAIAHGMYSYARTLASLGPRLPGAGLTSRVWFRKPVRLPSSVRLRTAFEPSRTLSVLEQAKGEIEHAVIENTW